MPFTYTQDLPGGSRFRCPLTVQNCIASTRQGNPCRRRSFRVPFCLQHARDHLGIDVRNSPGKGCGLYAGRTFRRGDAILPYHGEVFHSSDIERALASQGRRSSPYVIKLTNPSRFIDASCTRGYAGYVNTPSRLHGRTPPPNVSFQQLTISASDIARLFRVGGSDSDRWCELKTHQELGGRANRLRNLRVPIRRFPRALVQYEVGQSHMWLVANRDIAIDDEILVDYGTGTSGILSESHHTKPSPCR